MSGGEAAMDETRAGWAPRVGVAAWVAILILVVATLVIWSRSDFAPPGYVFMSSPFPLVALLLSLVAQASSGLVLMTRRPQNRVGWAIMAFTIVTAIAPPVVAATAGSQSGDVAAPVRWLAWAVGSFIFPAASFLAFLLAFVFPDGRLLSHRWRLALAGVALAAALAALAVALRPGPLLFFPTISTPVGGLTIGGTEWLSVAGLVLVASSGSLVAAALVARYRVSDQIARLQIRWYVAAGILLAISYVAHVVTILTLPPFDPIGELVEVINYVLVGVPPIAITIAILRYRLYDVDTIIGRAFVFGALTAILAGLYAASIRLFNAFFTAITGENSDLALVITTLILATTFTPIKSWLERIVESRLRPGRELSETTHLLADPAFVAAVDARIRAALPDPPAATRLPSRSSTRDPEG